MPAFRHLKTAARENEKGSLRGGTWQVLQRMRATRVPREPGFIEQPACRRFLEGYWGKRKIYF